MFAGGKAVSSGFRKEFERMARERKVPVLFAEDSVAASPVDGLHYSAADHGPRETHSPVDHREGIMK